MGVRKKRCVVTEAEGLRVVSERRKKEVHPTPFMCARESPRRVTGKKGWDVCSDSVLVFRMLDKTVHNESLLLTVGTTRRVEERVVRDDGWRWSYGHVGRGGGSTESGRLRLPPVRADLDADCDDEDCPDADCDNEGCPVSAPPPFPSRCSRSPHP